jgi:hypothetical protein
LNNLFVDMSWDEVFSTLFLNLMEILLSGVVAIIGNTQIEWILE